MNDKWSKYPNASTDLIEKKTNIYKPDLKTRIQSTDRSQEQQLGKHLQEQWLTKYNWNIGVYIYKLTRDRCGWVVTITRDKQTGNYGKQGNMNWTQEASKETIGRETLQNNSPSTKHGNTDWDHDNRKQI